MSYDNFMTCLTTCLTTVFVNRVPVSFLVVECQSVGRFSGETFSRLCAFSVSGLRA